MRTSHPQTSSLDRLADFIIDPHGDTYGDERERVRWYEAITVIWTLQTLLTSLALAVAAWFAPIAAKPYLWFLYAALSAPNVLGLIYLHQKKVQTPIAAKRPAGRIIQAVNTVFLFAAVIGLVSRSKTAALPPYITGLSMVIGVTVALLVVKQRNEKLRASDESDND